MFICVSDRRNLLIDLVTACLKHKSFNLNLAIGASNEALSSIKKAETHKDKLVAAWNMRRNDSVSLVPVIYLIISFHDANEFFL